MTRRNRLALTLAVGGLSLSLSAPALAQSPVIEGYGGNQAPVLSEIKGLRGGGGEGPGGGAGAGVPVAGAAGAGNSAAPTGGGETRSSALPFTGAEVGLIVAIGTLLGLVGLAMRRASSRGELG